MVNLLFTLQVNLSLGIQVCAITKLHWSWIVHDSPILQKRCELLRACSLLHGRKTCRCISGRFAITEFRW